MDEPARTHVIIRRDEPEIDHEATRRAVEAGMDTIVTRTSASALPYPDLPASHPANVDAIERGPSAWERREMNKYDLPVKIRLDLASGPKPQDGFEGVDMYADVKHRVNLLQFPWPWETSSVDEMFCSHFIEHIPMAYANPGFLPLQVQDPEQRYSIVPRDEYDRDLWCLFFDEAWRVLKPDGVFTVIWPALQSVRAFQDPTHRRFIPLDAMMYLQKGFREANGLGHYLGACDFMIDGPRTSYAFSIDEPGRTDEAIMGLIHRNWNVATDTKATLIAKK